MLNTAVRHQEVCRHLSQLPWPNRPDGKRLFVANSSADAVAVFDTSKIDTSQIETRKIETRKIASGSSDQPASASEPTLSALGFIPTDWYPSALAVHGDDLLIATAKGQGTGPNKGMGKTAWEMQTSRSSLHSHAAAGFDRAAEHSLHSRQARRTHARGRSTTTCCTTIPERFSSRAARIRSST